MSKSITADIEGSDQKIVVGAKSGYALLDRSSAELEYLKKVWDRHDGPGKEHR